MKTTLPPWFGFLAPPIIWAVRFGAAYALVPLACARDSVLLLQVITVVALAATAWAGLVAWRLWWRAGDEGAEGRSRFMAGAGLFSSGLFFLVIVAEGLALFLIDPCQSGGAPL